MLKPNAGNGLYRLTYNFKMFNFEKPNDPELTPKERLIETMMIAIAALMLLGFAVKIVFL